jgi:hypothetical protein
MLGVTKDGVRRYQLQENKQAEVQMGQRWH